MNSYSSSKSKHDLRFQVQTMQQNSHFGAIHMGGNMSFLKDSFLTNPQNSASS